MTERGKLLKYFGFGVIIALIVLPIVGIPTVLYITTPLSVEITYNCDTTQEKAIIMDLETMDDSSNYFANTEYYTVDDLVLNITELLHIANTRTKRIFRDFEFSYEASISAFSNTNLTHFNTSELGFYGMYLSYYNSTLDNYSSIWNIPSLISEKIQYMNETGLLNDSHFYITQKLFQTARRNFIATVKTFIERNIICNSLGQPLMIISCERSVTFS